MAKHFEQFQKARRSAAAVARSDRRAASGRRRGDTGGILALNPPQTLAATPSAEDNGAYVPRDPARNTYNVGFAR